jgi:subtilisin family serine protease
VIVTVRRPGRPTLLVRAVDGILGKHGPFRLTADIAVDDDYAGKRSTAVVVRGRPAFDMVAVAGLPRRRGMTEPCAIGQGSLNEILNTVRRSQEELTDAIKALADAVQSTGSPIALHNLSAPDVRTGGVLIVVDRTERIKDVTQSLCRFAGLQNVASSRELLQEQTPDVDAVVIERAGVIVVPARKEGTIPLNVLADKLTGVTMEPERLQWAIDIDPVWLSGYRAGVNAMYDSILAQDASTAGTGPQRPVSYVDGPTESWGLQAVGTSAEKVTGLGVRVAILDTGIDEGHPSFNGRIAGAQSFVPGEAIADGNGHGTHCAGTICGAQATAPVRFDVTPDVELYVGKVLSNSGSGADGDILAGIEWAIDSGCHVVSMSLGSNVPVPSVAYERLASTALKEGVLVVAAAGNNASRPRSRGFVGQPANADSILAVAAIDRRLGVASFSSGGTPGQPTTYPNLAAPGVQVFSSWPQPRLFHVIDGTSMACPHAAAAAAAWAQATGLRGRDLWNSILSGTRPLADIQCDIGQGLVQVP